MTHRRTNRSPFAILLFRRNSFSAHHTVPDLSLVATQLAQWAEFLLIRSRFIMLLSFSLGQKGTRRVLENLY